MILNGFSRRVPAVLWPTVLCALLAGRISGQSTGCLQGNVFYPLGVNGEIRLCPDLQGKAPDVQKQLDDIRKAVGSNQQLLRELTRTARGLNAVARNVDANRQVEMLQSFSRNLIQTNSGGREAELQKIEQLADKLDALQDTIQQSRSNEKTASETKAALNGRLGDALAALDLTRAQEQLDSIQAKLDTIGQEVQTTRRNTDAIRKTLEAHEKTAFAQVSVEAFSAAVVWEFRVKAVPAATQYDPKVTVVMLDIVGGNVRTVRKAVSVELPLSQFPNTYRTQVKELGGRVVVCYTAHAAGQPSAQRLTSQFKTQFNNGRPAFVLAEEPRLEPASEAACGGQEIAQIFREQSDAGAKEEAMIKPLVASTHPANPKDVAGTFYDARTGAMWTPSVADETMNYYAARQYCTDLKLAGHDDWRLPTVDELRDLYDPTRSPAPKGLDGKIGTIGIRDGIQLRGYAIWSGTPGKPFGNNGLFVDTKQVFDFRSGAAGDSVLMNYNRQRVLCVRSPH